MDEGDPDPASINAGLALKPVIKELARTQVCFPDIKLLVGRISVVTLSLNEQSKENQAYRLYLSDGEKTIQAVLKRKIHQHVTNFDVREGSYVILKAYRLVKGKKLNGKGNILYIVIDEFYSIGDDNRDVVDNIRHDLYCELIKTPQHQRSAPTYERYGHTKRRIFNYAKDEGSPRKKGGSGEHLSSYGSTPASVQSSAAQIENFPFGGSQASFQSTSYSSTPERNARKRDRPFDEIDLNLTPRSENTPKSQEDISNVNRNFSHSGHVINSTSRGNASSAILKHLDISYEQELERGNADGRLSQAQNESKPVVIKPIVEIKRRKVAVQNIRAVSFSPRKLTTPPSFHKSPHLNACQKVVPIKRPLSICSLEAVTGAHASRNKVFDFFAVIYSIEAQVVKPPMMPLKRDMRIVDPSTSKKVLVSVFVNPVNFKPSVGTIALFRSLTTHEWDRGMLNAYPQQCEGKDWFIVDPIGIEGCDVLALRNWWKLKSAETDNQEKRLE